MSKKNRQATYKRVPADLAIQITDYLRPINHPKKKYAAGEYPPDFAGVVSEEYSDAANIIPQIIDESIVFIPKSADIK